MQNHSIWISFIQWWQTGKSIWTFSRNQWQFYIKPITSGHNLASWLDEIGVHGIIKEKRKSISQEGWGGGVIKKVLYGEAPPAQRFNHLPFYYPVSRDFSLAWHLPFTKSSLVSRVVGLFTSRSVNKPAALLTGDANDFVNARSHAS